MVWVKTDRELWRLSVDTLRCFSTHAAFVDQQSRMSGNVPIAEHKIKMGLQNTTHIKWV